MSDPKDCNENKYLDALVKCLESDYESTDSSDTENDDKDDSKDSCVFYRCKTSMEDIVVPMKQESKQSSGMKLGMTLNQLFSDSLDEARDSGGGRFDWDDNVEDDVQGETNDEDVRDQEETVDDDGRQHQHTLPPLESQQTPRRRRGILANYFSSPTARQQRKKSSPCMFCNSNNDVFSLGEHLERSSNCKYCYFSLLHVSSIDGVIAKTFTCMFCPNGGNYLKPHLNSSNACLEAYFAKFNVSTIK